MYFINSIQSGNIHLVVIMKFVVSILLVIDCASEIVHFFIYAAADGMDEALRATVSKFKDREAS
jgi:hypothetical protein